MTTANELYERVPQEETKDLWLMFGCYFNHFNELVPDTGYVDQSCFKSQTRITVKILKHFDFDGRRFWNMSTVWLDEKPFMITHNAGREGDDSVARFITDKDVFIKAIDYLKTFMPVEQSTIDEDVIDPNNLVQTDFYGNHLDGYFERYDY